MNNEERLERELSKFFSKLKKEVLAALEEYWSEYQLLQGQVNLMTAPVHEAHREYYEILEKYIKREYNLGQGEAKRLVQRTNKKHALKSVQSMPIKGFIKRDNELFGTLPKAESDLLDRTYRTSEQTLSRVDSQINQIITDGYKSGQGINTIANDLTRRFDQLESWEAKRIARTEVHTSHNQAVMDTYKDLGVEYIQWVAADDDRTRESHLEVDGEIIPFGGKYSNGLEYPGDMSGPIEEWINCRCSNAPFVIPFGYIAPSFSPFREDDLVAVETVNPLEKLEEPTPVEPTEEQLRTNLSPTEYMDYTRNIDRDIENYTKNINETFKDDKKLVDFFKQKLDDAYKLKEELRQKALYGVETKPFEISPLENYSMDTLKKDIPIQEETFDKLMKWSFKRATKNKIEYGYQFDTNTGELINKEIRGKKGSVTFTQQGETIGSMHTHPPVEVDGMDVGGGSFPSKQDLKVYRSQKGADHLLGSPTEVWYVHAEENLNSSVLGQREIDDIYHKVYKEVGEKGQKLVREGKLKTDDASLRKFMDKEIGDGLLREFNTKEWQDKGFYIRRAYR